MAYALWNATSPYTLSIEQGQSLEGHEAETKIVDILRTKPSLRFV